MTADRSAGIRFSELHADSKLLLLPNAWDVGSALLFARLGFEALGTTSAGVAVSRGHPDGEHISFEEMLKAIADIARSVPVPVTADLETGFGRLPEDVAHNVSRVIQAGAVGINLEDALPGSDSGLVPATRHAETISAVRSITSELGVPLFINARTDALWPPRENPAPRAVSEAIDRCHTYAAAGADGVFIPGIQRAEDIRTVVQEIDLPLNVLALAAVPSVDELHDLGVRRLSLGSGPIRAAMGLVRRIAEDLCKRGSVARMFSDAIAFDEFNSLAADPR